ncbi:hypothetical protein B0T16DRAFT_395499 [Cercophora newfieldiana]|uniref:Uncharacterized protein n=1 Tax=Cercophora newfieldiana TaxID=92897 RepID=A0AA40CI98_9PEZI|nr:hypothetical protein B0T16DRAFT_395499 [Cercophora newfieldiana]
MPKTAAMSKVAGVAELAGAPTSGLWGRGVADPFNDAASSGGCGAMALGDDQKLAKFHIPEPKARRWEDGRARQALHARTREAAVERLHANGWAKGGSDGTVPLRLGTPFEENLPIVDAARRQTRPDQTTPDTIIVRGASAETTCLKDGDSNREVRHQTTLDTIVVRG